ncbi:MAG: response regulator [Alphaproteobacteria bacterium]
MSRADALLEDALTELLSNPSPLTAKSELYGLDLRLELLRSLISTMPLRLDEADPCGGCAMERATQNILHRLPLRPRIAFLLRTLEELCDDQIAYVMGVSPLQARLLIDLGSAAIASEISTRVLIVESDTSTADGLSTLIEELGHTTCGKAHSPLEALMLARQEKPGLILSELAFPEVSSGISMIEEILKDHDIPLIIITDRPDLWHKDCGITPAGIITKPFLSDTVRATVSKALFFNRRAKYPFWDYEKENFTRH